MCVLSPIMDNLSLLDRIRVSKIRKIKDSLTDQESSLNESSLYENISVKENYLKDKMHANSKIVSMKLGKNSSVHGCSLIFQSRSIIFKVMWSTVIICSLAFCTFNLVKVTRAYLERKPEVKVIEIHERFPLFPVVVLCNENALKTDKIKQFLNTTDEELDEQHIEKYTNRYIKKYLQTSSIQSLYEYSYRLNTTLIDCMFGIEDCSTEASWDEQWYFEYGLCFAFNTGFDSGGNQVVARHVQLPGFSHGLNLLLKLEKNAYNKSKSIGMKLFISHQGEYIFSSRKEILLTPGFYYSISPQKKITQRESGLKEKCAQDEIIKFANFSLSQRVITKYTADFCYLNCLSEEIAENCNCVEYSRPILEKYSKIPKCTDSAETQLCIQRQYSDWGSGNTKCLRHCNSGCFEVKYEPRVNMQKYCSPITNESCEENQQIKLSINFNDFNYLQHQVTDSLSLAEFLGHVGGLISLFTGFSIISFIETFIIALQLAGALIYIRCKNIRKTHRSNITSRKPFVSCQVSLEV